MAYSVGQYIDYGTGRSRWAVLCNKTCVWYFPERYGKRAAKALCARMNRI